MSFCLLILSASFSSMIDHCFLFVVLSEEVALGMALLGVTSVDQLRPEMVNAQPLLNNMWRPELPSILSRL